MEKKYARATEAATSAQDKTNITDTSSDAQRVRLLAALKIGPVTTLEARQSLNVLHPAGRIQELRDLGYQIVTHWQTDYTSEGHQHRVAKYVLLPGNLNTRKSGELKTGLRGVQ